MKNSFLCQERLKKKPLVEDGVRSEQVSLCRKEKPLRALGFLSIIDYAKDNAQKSKKKKKSSGKRLPCRATYQLFPLFPPHHRGLPAWGACILLPYQKF